MASAEECMQGPVFETLKRLPRAHFVLSKASRFINPLDLDGL